MTRSNVAWLTLAVATLLAPRMAAEAQVTDTAQVDSTFDIRSFWRNRGDRNGLTITSGKAYNRVEGLPIMLGPNFRGDFGRTTLRVAVLGIIRTAHSAHWDSENLGHSVTADARVGGRRGYSVGASSYDVVSPVERWQLPEPDAGLAAFFLKRDYLDYYGRHGARLSASAFSGEVATIEMSYAHERWSSRRERDVTTLFRSEEGWRINPLTQDGTVHLFETRIGLDSRNAELNPWAGWYLNADYEYGRGHLVPFRLDATRILLGALPGEPATSPTEYGRVFFDVRKYNRISPNTQLNARLAIGGWLHGDHLPLERRLSVGGIGTLPGFDFRRVDIGPDVGQCAPDGVGAPGRPALCERVALAQLEYRNELHSDLVDMYNRNGIRLRGAPFTVRPSIVAFVDAGRGWLVGERFGELQYPSGTLPPFGSYRTDLGLGLDLGVAGLYVAKAVSSAKEPANFFVRIHNRF
jgi:hypothetical protein